MSNPQSIPLRYNLDNSLWRLIELPPEVQSLLESDDPPVLTLQAADTFALLTTPSKTYAFHQKNTSNTILLLSHDGQSQQTSEHQDQNQQAQPQTQLTAISTIKFTVDLVPRPQQESHTGPSSANQGKWHQRFGSGR